MIQINERSISILREYYYKPGPRYTSYPPAPYFSKTYNAKDYEKAIIGNNENHNSNNISLYFHIPFCDSLCYFCGCFMTVTRNPNRVENYLQYLIREFEYGASYINRDRKVSQIHWGGGSPSLLKPEQIIRLASKVKGHFAYSKDCEASVEIDPRDLSYEQMLAFKEAGFNRISLGVQDIHLEVQQAINRIQPEEVNIQALKWARDLGMSSVNIDIMYGLPFQTPSLFAETVDAIIRYSPDRVSVFNFAFLPWMKKHHKLLDENTFPKPEERLEMLTTTISKLTTAGYDFIGMDHFAKKDDELAIAQKNNTLYRNFQGYSTNRNADLFAYGVSSISQFQNNYSQNLKDFDTYFAKIDEKEFPVLLGYEMTKDDILRKEVILEIMCNMVLTKSAFEKQFDIEFNNYFQSEIAALAEYEAQGLVELLPETIKITELGRLIIRNIAMIFDAYTKPEAIEQKKMFSNTV